MPHNFVADRLHTKNFVADFIQAKCDFTLKPAVWRFEPAFGGLRSNVRWFILSSLKSA